MKKLSTKKYMFLIIIIFILIVFKGVWTVFEFNKQVGSEELKTLTIEEINDIKKDIIKSSFSPGIVKFNFMSGIGVLAPILIVIIGFDYNKIKNNYIKFNIGKNNNYLKELKNKKIQLAFIGVGIVFFTYVFCLIISLIFGEIGTNTIYGKNLINNNSILRYLFANEVGYAIFTIINVSIAVFISSILVFYLIDYFGFIKGSISYLAYMWVGTVIMYSVINSLFMNNWFWMQILRYFVPMHSFMGITESSSTLITMICSYIGVVLPIVILKCTKKYEVA